MITGKGRNFLFLQGPHGPFFHRLGRMLRQAGAQVWRVGFNAGDQAFWRDKGSYIAFTGPPCEWSARFDALILQHGITDIVLYGDTRPIHAQAIARARAAGVTIHVFEEGYLRPYWVTYERDGSNGHSRLMKMSVSSMQKALTKREHIKTEAPAHWGDMRHHVFYGAVYHWLLMFRNKRYRSFRPHRGVSVASEFRLYLRRLLLMPYLRFERALSTRRITNSGHPFHLVLLQLEHDSNFQFHSPFTTMLQFLDLAIEGFADGAPSHHHLVFKAHPLETGRLPLRRKIRETARKHGIESRVHYVNGGKLAHLLDYARSAVTINSTAAQQVLWRGLPIRVFGDAVYAKPEFVSTQPLSEFFSRPNHPDTRKYRQYRQYLLETSQIPGGFYSARGRRQLLRQTADLLLAPLDPYDSLTSGNAAPRQQLRIVR